MKKTVLTFGSIAGAIVSGMLLFTFSRSNVDFDNAELLGYSTMILAFATIFFAVKSYRDKTLGGSIQFGKALKIGLGITLVASAIYILSWLIISNTIAKDFMTDYYQHSVEQLKVSDLTQAEIDQQIADMEYFGELYKNPLFKIGITFLEIFPVGLVVSLISALILKRK